MYLLDIKVKEIIVGRESKTEYVLLGLLLRQGRSGYELKKAMEETLADFWQESYGQIYPTLKKLTDRGAVIMEEDATFSKKVKKIYTITEKGKEEFIQWLNKDIQAQPMRDELSLKLFFGNSADKSTMTNHLQNELQYQEKRLEKLHGIDMMLDQQFCEDESYDYWKITVSRGIHDCNGKINWTKESLERLHKEK